MQITGTITVTTSGTVTYKIRPLPGISAKDFYAVWKTIDHKMNMSDLTAIKNKFENDYHEIQNQIEVD